MAKLEALSSAGAFILFLIGCCFFMLATFSTKNSRVPLPIVVRVVIYGFGGIAYALAAFLII